MAHTNIWQKMKIKKDLRKAFLTSIVLLISIALVIVVIPIIPLQLNTTSSVKKGIYYIKKSSDYHAGDYVVFCLDDGKAKIAYKRKYIKRGSCPNGYEPLLKKIIGVPGDSVSFAKNIIKTPLGNYYAPILDTDSNNKPINFLNHDRNFTLKGFWMHGDNNIKSYDSRYFGQINKQQIQFIAKPLLIF